MPQAVVNVLKELGVNPDKVSAFSLTWEEVEGTVIEFKLSPELEKVEITVTSNQTEKKKTCVCEDVGEEHCPWHGGVPS